jgi:hypothetical protein
MEKGEVEIHTNYLTSIDIWFSAMKAFSVMSLIESLVVLALIKRARGMVNLLNVFRYNYFYRKNKSCELQMNIGLSCFEYKEDV